jgi:hypothetical protein
LHLHERKEIKVNRTGINPHHFRILMILVVTTLLGCLMATAAAIYAINPVFAQSREERLALDRFLFSCDFSHRAKDDPITLPGQKGAAHSHDFFANRSTNANSTYERLLAARTTCSRDGDTAAYWVPTLYQNGRALRPDTLLIYYNDKGDPESVRAFPPDLRMIAGDHMAESPQPTHVTSWFCDGTTTERTQEPPRACPGGSRLTLSVIFPNCWDGQNLDSADHQSHMAYSGTRPCPSTHPVRTPTISLAFKYPTSRGTGLTFASGSRYTAHADFINAWDQGELEKLVRRCINDQTRTSDTLCRPPRS